MKKFGFLIAASLLAFTSSVQAFSIHIPNLTSYDFDAWVDKDQNPPVSSEASIDLYFDKKPDINPDPGFYEFENAFTKIDVHLNAFVNGVWEDQSFTIEAPEGSGIFKLDHTYPDWPVFLLSGPGFLASIQTFKVGDEYSVLDVAATIHNYEYIGTEEAYFDLSGFDVPEPSPAAILLLGLFAAGAARVKSAKQKRALFS